MVTNYVEAGGGHLFLLVGMNQSPANGFKDNKRHHLLILNGMLLQSEVKMIRIKRWPWVKYENCPDEEKYWPAIPDLANIYQYEELPCFDDEAELTEYIFRFTENVIPLLHLSSESKNYIKENLGRVIDYLVPKLRNGHLKFYKLQDGKGPEENGAIVFGDFSDPEEPTLLYPVFGMEAVTSGSRRIPWKPCQNESEEPVVTPFKAVRCYSGGHGY